MDLPKGLDLKAEDIAIGDRRVLLRLKDRDLVRPLGKSEVLGIEDHRNLRDHASRANAGRNLGDGIPRLARENDGGGSVFVELKPGGKSKFGAGRGGCVSLSRKGGRHCRAQDQALLEYFNHRSFERVSSCHR